MKKGTEMDGSTWEHLCHSKVATFSRQLGLNNIGYDRVGTSTIKAPVGEQSICVYLRVCICMCMYLQTIS